jgi:xylose isomerase
MSLFSEINPIRFEGPKTDNEFAYRVYDKDRIVLGKRMEEWLRLTVCYWHSFNWPGADMFGSGTLKRPWLGEPVTQAIADEKLEAAFDFFTRIGAPYFTFHDVDAMASANTLREHETNLRAIEARMAEKMTATGIKLAIFAQPLEKVKLASTTVRDSPHRLPAWRVARNLHFDNVQPGLRYRPASNWS